MSVIDYNGWFQGGLRGYGVEGFIEARHEVKSPEPDNYVYRPKTGWSFAALDNVWVDEDGERVFSGVKTSFIDYHDDGGNTTRGADGAILSVKNLTIAKGRTLMFSWAFLNFESDLTWNDFSYFFAYKGDGNLESAIGDGKVVHKVLLSDGYNLDENMDNHTGWRDDGKWKPEQDFSGTVCWVVSNGQSGGGGLPGIRAKALPATLLVDRIRIRNSVA